MPKLHYALTLAACTTLITGCFSSSSDDNNSEAPSKYKKTVFIQSPSIPGGSNGFTFDAQDQLYLTSIFSRTIYVIDRETGKIKKTFSTESGVEGPDDIVLDADNTMYWTSPFSGEIGKTTQNGETITQFVAPFVNPIAFSNDGRLFTCADAFASGFYELDPNLVATPRLIDPNFKLNGMDFISNNVLYSASPTLGKIFRVGVDQAIETAIVEGVDVPAGVKFNSKGELFGGNAGNGRVYRVNLQTNELETLVFLEIGIDNIEFDSQDRLFVSNSHDGSIIEVLPDNSLREAVPPGFVTPSGIAVKPRSDGGTSVFLADVFALIEFDATTGKELSHARDDLLPGKLQGPSTVAIDGDNFILTSFIFTNVQVWDHTNKEPVAEYEGFAGVVNAIRFQEDIVVAELGADFKAPRLILVNDNKRQVIADASQGLVTPAGLVAKDGHLWISDWSTGKILQVVSDGIPLVTPITAATGLDKPEGLAVDSAGRILIVESGKGQLSRLDLITGKVKVIAKKLGLGREGIPGMLPTFMFNGVAVDEQDVIYVTGEIDNVIYRIKPKKERSSLVSFLKFLDKLSVKSWWTRDGRTELVRNLPDGDQMGQSN